MARPTYLPPWRLDIDIRDGVSSPLTRVALARTMARALDAAGAPAPAILGLILADDAELAALNAEHMGHEGPTDVLSFPLLSPGAFPEHAGQDPAVRVEADRFVTPPGRRVHLGDIVVSVERAVEQAGEGRGGHGGNVSWSAAEEVRLLVTHGVLHVCGWDHALPAEEAAMRALERELLAAR
jgi:probable rRNA maturation factor